MNSLRKWFYRPRKDDPSLLAQFFYSDEEFNMIASELDSFDGRKDPERCTSLVNQLRQCQDRVLSICIEMMDELLPPEEREPRDFRVKFPDDVMQENLAGQLWFGAECLAAGSSILNREIESNRMRPLAKAVTKTIETVRNLLRDQCLKPIPEYTEKIRESLKILDRLFADFELNYVSAMVPVKTPEEYFKQQLVVVLFSETLQRAVKLSLVDQEQIDGYDPALMFTIPRLAIVAGLLIFKDVYLPLNKDHRGLSEMFKPFKTLLIKIRELLWTLSAKELATLEKCLCSMEEPDVTGENISNISSNILPYENLKPDSSIEPYMAPPCFDSDFVDRFYSRYPSCLCSPDLFTVLDVNKKEESDALCRTERTKRDRASVKANRARARQERQNEKFLYRLTGESQPKSKRRPRSGCRRSQPHSYNARQNLMARSSGQYHPSAYNSQAYENSVYHQTGYRHYRTVAGGVYSSRHSHSDYYQQRGGRADSSSAVMCGCGSGTPHTREDHQRLGRRRHTPPNHPPREHLNLLYPQPIGDEHESYNDFFHQYQLVGQSNSGSVGFIYHQREDRESFPAGFASAEHEPSQAHGVSSSHVQKSLREVVTGVPDLLSPGAFCDSNDNIQSSDHVPISTNLAHLSLSEEIPEELAHLHGSETPSYLHGLSSERVDAQSTTHSSNTKEIEATPTPTERNISTTLRPYGALDNENCNTSCNTISKDDANEETLYLEGRVDNSSDADTLVSHSSQSLQEKSFEATEDEEVALGLQAAEIQIAWKARNRFSSSGDLIHRLFVCISGVADQLQTNYASDLRKILKSVFLLNQSEEVPSEDTTQADDTNTSNHSEQLSVDSAEDALIGFGSPDGYENMSQERRGSPDEVDELPDETDGGCEALSRQHSIVISPSVFNEHSLLQFSNLSPPQIPTETSFADQHNSSQSSESAANETLEKVQESPADQSPSTSRTSANESQEHDVEFNESNQSEDNEFGENTHEESRERDGARSVLVSEPPAWVPDNLAPRCMACGVAFTVIRRRHHCRNCGKVFCGQCSRHNVPLPHFGVWQSVRVCNACFLYYVTSSADGSAALAS